MADKLGTSGASGFGSRSEESGDYLSRAQSARETGDLVLAMHLYLAAYEKAHSGPVDSAAVALTGLREAWQLACDLRERSMAEYVFEKLEPYLTGNEIAECASCLQDLALDRLEEYGFSRDELKDMAEMISEELMESEGSIVTVESITIPAASASSARNPAQPGGEDLSEHPDPARLEPPSASRKPDDSRKVGFNVAPADGFNPYELYDTSSVGTSYHAATNDGSGAYIFTRDEDRAAESAQLPRDGAGKVLEAPQDADRGGESETADAAVVASGAKPELEGAAPDEAPREGAFSYRGLSGYDEAISVMRDLGIGLNRDRGFSDFVGMLNAQHGLDRMPALDTLLLRAPAVEDATRFLEATIGEIGLPVLRMAMEENAQGMPVLSVAVQGDNRPRMNHAHNRFEGPAVLVIEELDLWAIPSPPEGMEGIGGFLMASMTRGAREAINLIRSAVEDPDVYVLVTASSHGEIEPFFYDLIEPVTIIDIADPTEAERSAIWAELARAHPSMRSVNRDELVRFSAGLSRYDIYLAARSALEEAYKAGLVQRRYVPVTDDIIFDKLAACHPLDSEEYSAIEDAIVRAFGEGLADLEELVDGPRE